MKSGDRVIVKVGSANNKRLPGVVNFYDKQMGYMTVTVKYGTYHRSQDVNVVFVNRDEIKKSVELNEDFGWLVFGRAVEAGEDVPEMIVVNSCGAKRAGNSQIGTNTYGGWVRLGPPFISEREAQSFINQFQNRPPAHPPGLWPW